MELDGLVRHQKAVLQILESIEQLWQEHREECGSVDSAEHRVKFYRAGVEVWQLHLDETDADEVLVYAVLNNLYYTHLAAAKEEIMSRARIASQN